MKRELITALVVAGTFSIGCAVPSESKAYYEASTDTIHYREGTENDRSIVLHEEEHQNRAHKMGRFIWGFRYWIDPEFACEEEIAANIAGNIKPYNDHIACEGVIFQNEIATKP